MAQEQRLVRLADRVVGRQARQAEEYFQDLQDDLLMADIGLGLHDYLAVSLFTGFVVFVAVASAISLVMGLATVSAQGIISGVILGVFAGMFLGTATFMAFYVYPSVRVGQRRADIDNNLPFATMYLATIAGTGTPPAALFNLLGGFEEYGEVSREAQRISRDIYTFGADTTEALRGAAQRTPSDKFRELLWGINSIITAGGDLRAYLQEKSESFMEDYRRSLNEFTDRLALLVEIYITLVIVGSVFLIILSTIMSATGAGNTGTIIGIQLFTVFFLLPFAAALFIVVVKGISPLT